MRYIVYIVAAIILLPVMINLICSEDRRKRNIGTGLLYGYIFTVALIEAVVKF